MVKRFKLSLSSDMLEHAEMPIYPHTDDPLVQALQRLLDREGGHVTVGDAAGVNDQSLYQIATCRVDSKTGTAKGVGPSIRKRLTNRYPDWLDAASTTESSAPTINEALMRIGIELARDLPDFTRDDLADEMAKWVRRKGAEHSRLRVAALLTDDGAATGTNGKAP